MAFPPNFALTRPESYSDTTEIIDTDFDSDSLEAYSDDYSRKSVRSVRIPFQIGSYGPN